MAPLSTNHKELEQFYFFTISAWEINDENMFIIPRDTQINNKINNEAIKDIKSQGVT